MMAKNISVCLFLLCLLVASVCVADHAATVTSKSIPLIEDGSLHGEEFVRNVGFPIQRLNTPSKYDVCPMNLVKECERHLAKKALEDSQEIEAMLKIIIKNAMVDERINRKMKTTLNEKETSLTDLFSDINKNLKELEIRMDEKDATERTEFTTDISNSLKELETLMNEMIGDSPKGKNTWENILALWMTIIVGVIQLGLWIRIVWTDRDKIKDDLLWLFLYLCAMLKSGERDHEE